MNINVERLSLVELQALEDRIAQAKRLAYDRTAKELRAKLADMAAKQGLTVKDVLGHAAPGPARRVVKVTPMRDPKTGAVWAGRGKYPAGFVKSRAEPLSAR